MKVNEEDNRLIFILPVFNGASTILETVNSLLAQLETLIEVIIIDNGSTDETLSIINSIQDERVKVHSMPHTQSLGESLNRALNLKIEPPFCICHADDVYDKYFAYKMIENMQKYPDADILFCQSQIIGKNSMEIWSIKNFSKNVINLLFPVFSGSRSMLRLMFFNSLIAPSACFTKSFDTKKYFFHPDYVFFTDIHLWSRLLFSGYRLRVLKFKGIKYRVHKKQQSVGASSWPKQRKEMSSLTNDFSKFSKFPFLFRFFCKISIWFRWFIYLIRKIISPFLENK